MKYRTLGKTNLKVSELGYGTWQIANDPGFWVGADVRESLRCLYRFFDLGGNFIDTAWIYGYFEARPDKHPSEELVGQFVKETGKRDQIIIATKVPPKNMKWPAWRGVPISEVFPDDHVKKCVNDSLKSLGVDYIDLMQFHVWQDDFAKEDGWKKVIEKITQEGKVKHWGISVNDYQPSNCLKTLGTGLISTVQCIFNVFHQRPIGKLFPYAKDHNIGIIARVPLDEGGLSGKFTPDTVFAEDDFRSKYFTLDRLKELTARTNELKQLLNDDVKTLAELSYRFILSFEEVSTLITGMTKTEHIEANTFCSDKGGLSSVLINAIKRQSWERNFYPDIDPSMASSNYLEE